MIRSTILALLLVLSSLVAQRGSAVYGYSTLSSIWSPTTLHQQRASYFVGRDVLSPSSPSSSSHRKSVSSSFSVIEMKKGKANLPSHMRSQYKRSQEMEAYRQQMMESQKMGTDGLPVFNLYVRGSAKNMWYPCGSFKGDEKSAALCQSYASDGLLADISKNQLDAGVGSSLARDVTRLEETIVRGYPQLRKEKGKLEYGYKLAYVGLSDEKAKKVNLVELKEQKGFLDGIKNTLGLGGAGGGGGETK